MDAYTDIPLILTRQLAALSKILSEACWLIAPVVSKFQALAFCDRQFSQMTECFLRCRLRHVSCLVATLNVMDRGESPA